MRDDSEVSEDASSPSSVADMAAVGKLLEEQRPRLLAMLKRRIDPALAARLDAEDVLGEAFFMACRKWKAFKGQSELTPYAWLYRIALDCLIEAWRKETRVRRDPRIEMPWPEQSSVQMGLNLVGTGTSPSAAGARAELQQRMQQTLKLLRPMDQEILWIRHSDQLTFREAAQVLGLTQSATSLRYVRALKRLKQLWRQLYGEGTSDEPPDLGSQRG